MTLTQSLQTIKKEVSANGTPSQQNKLQSMSVSQLNEMTQMAQSMGVASAISMHL